MVLPTLLDYMRIKRDYVYKWLRVQCLGPGKYSTDVSYDYAYCHDLKVLEKQWGIFRKLWKGH